VDFFLARDNKAIGLVFGVGGSKEIGVGVGEIA